MNLSEPQYEIFASNKPRNLFMAGQGSGKTYVDGVVSATYVGNFPMCKGLIAANTYDQLNRSTMYRIREVWKQEFGLHEYDDHTGKGNYVIGRKPPRHFNKEQHNFDRYDNIISFVNGHVIYVGSLDNYKALEGMEVAWAILDETKDTKEEAVKEVITGRIRQVGIYLDKNGVRTTEKTDKTLNPLYVTTSPAKVPWLNDWFGLDDYEEEIMSSIFSKDDYFLKHDGNKCVTISSVYLNEKNLPAGWIENQKENLASHLQDMLIYGCPFAKTGGEFYKCFDREAIVKKCEYNPLLPLHITFDENVNPYITLLVHQVGGKTARQIDEICLESPRNTLEDACKEFTRIYRDHRMGLYIYGDATSRKADAKLQKFENFYTLVSDRLRQFRPVNRVPKANPSVSVRGDWINTTFEKNFDDVKLYIDPSCKKTIADYQNVKEAADGKKAKINVVDPQTKVRYQKWGHCTDANDYFYCEVFKNSFTLYVKGPKPYDYKIVERDRKDAY